MYPTHEQVCRFIDYACTINYTHLSEYAQYCIGYTFNVHSE